MKLQRLYDEIDPYNSTVPAWAAGAVIYQIFPDRFYNGNPQNDVQTGEYTYGEEYAEGCIPVERVPGWNDPVKPLDVVRFYGGDLPGILEKLPHLKALGVEALYLNPVFQSLSNHKYDTLSYEHIDPHLTTGSLETSDAYFAEFVRICHENGIRVILDGVFNHCSSKNTIFTEALKDKNSPLRDWFSFSQEGVPEYWWNVKTLPKLNYEGSPALTEYMMGIARKWVSAPYSCDGWRLGVAPELAHSEEANHAFWRKFRETVKEANSEAIILAETYDDPSSHLTGDEWDTCMNYRGFMDPVSFYVTGMEKHSDEKREDLFGNAAAFLESMQKASHELPPDAAFTAMNQLDNHDHSRFITRTAKIVGRLLEKESAAAGEETDPALYKIAAVLQFTWVGCPTIYYGDETALPGFTDPDSRRPYPWDSEDYTMVDFFSCLSKIHKDPVFRYGSLTVADPGETEGTLLFIREYRGEKALIVVNPKDEWKQVTLTEQAEGSSYERILSTSAGFTSFGRKAGRAPVNGTFTVNMPPEGAKIYRFKNS